MLIGPVMDPQLDPRWCTQSKNAARTATSEGSANGPKQIASKIQLCFFLDRLITNYAVLNASFFPKHQHFQNLHMYFPYGWTLCSLLVLAHYYPRSCNMCPTKFQHCVAREVR
jgi:hypothetical protein